ncbi:MAG: hypothetical protein EOP10_10135 [Proteobacteria bacterium]|nr:MAG: hypothetical protein EOP10_10135 [Pseudomonadota bacterium]
MQKVRVFLNQQASQSAERDWQALIRQCLFRSELEFVTPQSPAQFDSEIDRATKDNIDIIISVGGDGTIHALIQKLAGKQTAFLPLPAGTANDLSRSLGLQGLRVHDALINVRRAKPKPIDLIDINGRLMATNGGVGIVADCATQINELRQTVPGFRKIMNFAKGEIYGLILGSKLLQGAQRHEILIESDELSGQFSTPMLLINNQPSIAARFKVAPNTKHDDGTFNVTVFLHKRTTDFIASVYRIRQGVPPENDPLIRSFETKAIRFKCLDGKKIDFIGDGELLSVSDVFDVSLRPKALLAFAETVEQIPHFDYSKAGAVG